MSSGRVPSETKSFLRSVLTSSNGVKETKVEKDYLELAGEKLNWRKLGFGSLRQFLCAMPDVCRLQYSSKDKVNRVYAVELKGIYMSSHAKKNVKSAPSVVPTQELVYGETKTSGLSQNDRKVQEDGDSLKITIAENTAGGIEPNMNGLYQVYVANLSKNCTESDLKNTFSTYGVVKEADIVTSSRNKKIAFIRYQLKNEALRALTEGKAHPPLICGQTAEVGVAKCKNVSVETSVKAVLNFESENGSEIMPLMSTSSPSPTRSSAFKQPRSPSVLPQPVFINDTLVKNFPTGENTDNAPDVLDEPLYAVNVTGYNRKMVEDDLWKAFQNTGKIAKIEYHPMYSIIKFTTQNEAMNAVQDMNGKFVNGSVFLVSALKQNWPVEGSKAEKIEEVDATKLENDFSKVYSLYDEAVVACCGQTYQSWLNSLSSFQMKILEVIDPCTFWVHIHDGTHAYKIFNDLVGSLKFINTSSKQKSLEKNQFGAGLFSEDGDWYRCYCSDVSPDQRQVHIMYIDYGNCEWLETNKVIWLPHHFFQLRPMGVLVRLSGLKFNPNQDEVIVNNALLSVKSLLMNGKEFNAKKVSFDPFKHLLLEVDILTSEGGTINKNLSTLPGFEMIPRSFKESLAEISNVFTVRITNIRSPTTFYFQLINEKTRKDLENIQELLSKCDIQHKVDIKNIKEHDLVCYHKNGHERSRVQLLLTSRPHVPGQVNVLHVDIGKETMVPCTSFISLPASAPNIFFQARPASLYKVPNDLLAQSSAALDLFVRNSTKVLRANVVLENEDQSVVVELFDAEGESINKKLLEIVNNNAATPVQPLNSASTMSNHTSAARLPSKSNLTVDTSCKAKHPVTSQERTSHGAQLSPIEPATKNTSPPGAVWNGMEIQQGVSPVRNPVNVKPIEKNEQSPTFLEANSTSVQSEARPSIPLTTTMTKTAPGIVKPGKTKLPTSPSGETTETTVEKQTLQNTSILNAAKTGQCAGLENPVVHNFGARPGFSTSKQQAAVRGTECSDAALSKTNEQNTKETKAPSEEASLSARTVHGNAKKTTIPFSKTALLATPSRLYVPGGVAGGKAGGEPDKSQERVPDWQTMDYESLINKVQKQEKTLSRSASEQRQFLIRQKMKEKLEVQVGIKVLENAIFALENEVQSLKKKKDDLEKQQQQ